MSTLKADTIVAADGSSPVTLTKQSAAKAWVNFNGTGTIAARDSLNLSSLSDDGSGNYRVNLVNAMSNANYLYVGSAGYNTVGSNGVNFTASNGSVNMGASVFGVRVDLSGTNTDVTLVCTSAHGDLA